jgi:Ca-activated chloride channel homolog
MQFASTCREWALRPRPAVVVAVLLIMAGAPASDAQDTRGSAAAPTAPLFRSQTELVVLQAVVADSQHRYVADLNREDFAVYEEGARQTVALFASTEAPLDLVLLIDTSASMHRGLAIVQEAAVNFLRTLRDGDRAAVVLFNHAIRMSSGLTSDRTALESLIRSASAAGATAVHRALYIALRELDRARRTDGLQRRQALVLLSDGADNVSEMGLDTVLEEVRRSPVTIFAILPLPPGVALRSALSEPAPALFDLRHLADETGGRTFLPSRIEDLAGVYEDIAGELTRQYWLAYVPPPASTDEFRRVSVRVETRPGLLVRTRNGYYARSARRDADRGRAR